MGRAFFRSRRGAWDRLLLEAAMESGELSVGASRSMGQRLLRGAAIHRNEETRFLEWVSFFFSWVALIVEVMMPSLSSGDVSGQ